MGYTTKFKGVIRANKEFSPEIRAKLKKVFKEKILCSHLDSVCDWTFAGKDGLKWNGMEKTRDLPEWLVFIIQDILPDTCGEGYQLSGTINAQGEDPMNHWVLTVKDNQVMVSSDDGDIQIIEMPPGALVDTSIPPEPIPKFAPVVQQSMLQCPYCLIYCPVTMELPVMEEYERVPDTCCAECGERPLVFIRGIFDKEGRKVT